MAIISLTQAECVAPRRLGGGPIPCIVKNKPGEASSGGSQTFFGGTLLSSRSQRGVSIAEVEYDNVRQCRQHTHDQSFFALLLRGSYAERAGGSTMQYHRFSLGFHQSDTLHTDDVLLPRTRMLLIHLSDSWIRRLQDCSVKLSSHPRVCNSHGSWLAFRLYQEHRDSSLQRPLVEESLVLEMLSTLVRDDARGQQPPWSSRALDLLHSEFSRKLTVAGVADLLGLHPIYLSRQFRRVYGQSIGEFVHHLRLCSAAEQLRNVDVPLSEIALAAGFSDQSQFTKAFKRRTGMTPGAFRRFRAFGAPPISL
jgi:AraC family transcriptional regulator